MATKAAKKPAPKAQVPTKRGEVPGALILMGDQQQVPDYIKPGNRGSEHVGTEDMVIPRLEVVQALSPALERDDPNYIEGAKQGDLVNSVTRQNYGKEVFIVPVYYTKQWLVWKDRTKGGGFFGAYPSPAEAEARIEQEGDDALEAIDTPTHLCLLIDPQEGKIDEIMISMPRTKAKISRQWNSMIKLAGGDRFSRVYRVTTALEENKKGKFQNYVVQAAGFPAKVVYDKAEKLYQAVSAGDRTVVMDTTGFQEAEVDPEGNSEM